MHYVENKFLIAQEQVFPYEDALAEIKRGYKSSHWMWFIFPQIKGLGDSHMTELFELKNFDEARVYINNETLKHRLLEISQAVYHLDTEDIECVMGYPDNLKLQSCMTLFALVAPEYPIFKQVLDRYYKGKMCEYTVELFNQVEGSQS